VPRGPKGEKRPLDGAKTAYHAYRLAEQLSELRHGWGRIKETLFEFFYSQPSQELPCLLESFCNA
jgi:hypothetical protein